MFLEIGKNQKEIMWLLMVTPRKSGSGELLEYLILLMIFFSQKIQEKVLGLEIQLILSILWLCHLKISVKLKNSQKV